MASNDFLTFAAGGAANVESQVAYAADSHLLNGLVSGIVPSNLLNKTLRQSSIISAMVAQFIADKSGANSVDDGTTATLENNLTLALNALADIRYAKLAGLSTQSFSVANATTSNQAVALGQFTQSIVANGYQKLPSGLIIQWGAIPTVNAGVTVTFPIAFPTACFSVADSSNTATQSAALSVQTVTLTSFYATYPFYNIGSQGLYIAIGY